MILALAVLGLPGPFAPFKTTGISVQMAKINISPPELLPLGGYTERHGEAMEPGGQPLYARCELFSHGGTRVAMVSAEMLTIPESLAREVRKRLPDDITLFLSATHTHCAPDSQMLNDRMKFAVPGIASFKSRWLSWYADRIAACVEQSERAAPQTFSTLGAILYDEPLNHGRRKRADPQEQATVLESGRSHRLFLSYAAHPVFFDSNQNQTNGDWPGALSSRLEPPNGCFLVLAGALGDVSPRAPGDTPEAKIANFCKALISGMVMKERAPEDVWSAGSTFAALSMPIKLDKVVASPAFIDEYKVPKALASRLIANFAPAKAFVTAVRFGKLIVLGIPGEPTSLIGRRIEADGLRIGFKAVVVVSHVNGWIGYILDPQDYQDGGYEASLSFNGPQEGEHVVDACDEAMKKLRGSVRSALPSGAFNLRAQ